jgi:hemoglobin/transferrin/lactoferrin receptor protein
MNAIKAFLLVCFLASVNLLSGQQIKVIDRQTGKAIPQVLIYNRSKSHSALSNLQGKADLSSFSGKDTVVFQHPSYQRKVLPFSVLRAHHFKVMLNEAFVDLNEVVVSANKWEEKKNEIPNKIEQIKSRDILLNNPATSADMLAQSQSVFVQKSQLGGGSPMIRGFAANRILFVVDGIRMNNAIYRSGNLQNILQADVNSMAGAEIIFGPGTNIYGSDALGGVMDIHLLNPTLNDEKSWRASGHVYGRLASAAFEKSFHADVNVGNDKMAFLTSVSFTDFDDLRMGSRGSNRFNRNEYVARIGNIDSIVSNPNPLIQKYSGYSQLNLMQKLKCNFNKKTSMDVGVYYSATSDVPRYDRLSQLSHGKLKYAQWYYRPQSWLMGRVGMHFHKQHKLYDRARFSFAYQQVQEGRNDRKYKSNALRQRVEKVDVLSLNAHFNKSMGRGQFLFYGGEWDYNDVHSTGVETNIISGETAVVASRYPDGGTKTHQAGLYLSYKKLFDKFPLSFTSGMRFSFASLSSDFIDTTFYHLPYTHIGINNQALTGNVGFVYHPMQWQIRLNLSSGFRAPNLDDVAKIFDSEPGNVVVPNENLQPETLYNVDFGVKKSFGQKADAEITFFYSYLYHAMVRRDFQLNGQDSIVYDGQLSRVQAVVNAGYATVYGLSFETEIQLTKGLGVKSNLSIQKGKDDTGEALRHVPPLYGAVALFYEQSKLRIDFSSVFNGELSYENLAPSERDKAYMYALNSEGLPYVPAWWTLNLRANYAFSETVLAGLAVENMLDHAYRPYSSGISAPGINVLFTLRYSF